MPRYAKLTASTSKTDQNPAMGVVRIPICCPKNAFRAVFDSLSNPQSTANIPRTLLMEGFWMGLEYHDGISHA